MNVTTSNMAGINPRKLFLGSCFALITTAFSFSIRAGILPQLADTFSLSAQQLGFINSMWFLGFPISMVLALYRCIGEGFGSFLDHFYLHSVTTNQIVQGK